MATSSMSTSSPERWNGSASPRDRGTTPPTAEAFADPDFGPAPLTVQFDGSGSTDPDGDTLTYTWDLNGDGLFNTSDGPERLLVDPTFTYSTAGLRTIQLRVRDTSQAQDTDTVSVDVGNTPPTATITSPATGSKFAVGQTVALCRDGQRRPGRPAPGRRFLLEFRYPPLRPDQPDGLPCPPAADH